jgi:allantoinase
MAPRARWGGGGRGAGVSEGPRWTGPLPGDGWGASLGQPSPQPDVLNYSWREYGNRVGAWRCLDLFGQFGLPAAAILNTALYDHCPELVAACVERGDELVAHGHTNAERQGGWS